MNRTLHFPKLGASVTIRADPLDGIRAARATQAEVLQILRALSATDTTTALMLRSAVAMAQRVDDRLAAMEG